MVLFTRNDTFIEKIIVAVSRGYDTYFRERLVNVMGYADC